MILTTAEFHTMRMQTAHDLLYYLRCDSTHKQPSNFADLRLNGATQSLHKFTENIKGEAAHLITIVDDCRLHEFTEIAKMAIAKSCLNLDSVK